MTAHRLFTSPTLLLLALTVGCMRSESPLTVETPSDAVVTEEAAEYGEMALQDPEQLQIADAAQAEPAPPPMVTSRRTESRVRADVEGSAAGSTRSPSRPSIDATPRRERERDDDAESTRRPAHQGIAQPSPVTNDFTTIASLPAGSEHYTEYGVNGFVNPSVDALSTFAADVDTASYAVTRRTLRDGYLPPTAAVRVEEFINAIPYEYAQPERGFPFAVDFEAAPSPFNARNHIVRVGIQGRHIEVTERRPVHLTFLVDVSGSMRSSDKIGLLKQSLTWLTQELEDGDTVAIATYAGRTDIVLNPTPVRDAHLIIAALDGLTAGGSTAMSSGIDLAYRLADQTFVSGDVNRVFVCSDGDANVGTTSHTAMSEQIRGYAHKGITLTTLGFGNGNYQDTMMERLANDGDGNYFYIDGEAEARKVLVDNLIGTLEVIAKDVKIQVEWDPSQVLAYRLLGYENRDVADRDFRNDAVDAGEIGAGHQVTALYEVALADDAHGDLGTVRIRNKAPGADSPAVERTYALDAKTVRDRFVATSRTYRMAVAASAFAEVLRGSPHMNEVRLSEVGRIAQDAQRAEYSEDAELIELIDRAAKLRGEGALVLR